MIVFLLPYSLNVICNSCLHLLPLNPLTLQLTSNLWLRWNKSTENGQWLLPCFSQFLCSFGGFFFFFKHLILLTPHWNYTSDFQGTMWPYLFFYIARMAFYLLVLLVPLPFSNLVGYFPRLPEFFFANHLSKPIKSYSFYYYLMLKKNKKYVKF